MVALGDIQRVGILIILHVAEVICIHAQAESAGDGEGPIGGHAWGRKRDTGFAAEIGPVLGSRGDQRTSDEGVARKREVERVHQSVTENMRVVQRGVVCHPVVRGIECGQGGVLLYQEVIPK